jgi:hypothetical protein
MQAKPVKAERRKFLASMVAAGSAAAVVAFSPGEESAAQSAEGHSQTPEPASKGYQRTAHVEAYYRSLRT